MVERRLIKASPNRREATAMVITDIILWHCRTGAVGQWDFPGAVFRPGVGVLHRESAVLVEGRSLPVRWWAVALSGDLHPLGHSPAQGELPQVSEALASRLRWIINIELVGFASIPVLATLMARGVGLPAA